MRNHQGQAKQSLADTTGTQKLVFPFSSKHTVVFLAQITVGVPILPKKPGTSPLSSAPPVGVLPPGKALQLQKFLDQAKGGAEL